MINKQNERGQSALYCAAHQGFDQIVLALLSVPNIDINIQVPLHGGTPLHSMKMKKKVRSRRKEIFEHNCQRRIFFFLIHFSCWF